MLTLHKAQEISKRALAKAQELDINITVCVVDEHGSILSTQRMEKALNISPEFAMSKAYTSAVLGMPTEDIAKYAGPGQPYYGVTSAFAGKMMVIAGGLPIVENGKVVGGVGVGGSADVGQDVACAKAGLVE